MGDESLFWTVCAVTGFCCLLGSAMFAGVLVFGMVRDWWLDRDAVARMDWLLMREQEDMEVAQLEEWYDAKWEGSE